MGDSIEVDMILIFRALHYICNLEGRLKMKKWLAALGIPIISGLVIFFIQNSFNSPNKSILSQPEIVVFSANPEVINPGQESLLSWKTKNTTEVTLNGRVVAVSGSKHVNPLHRTVYNLVATNEGRHPVNETQPVDVREKKPARIKEFAVEPAEIYSGEKVTLKWETEGAIKVLLEGQPVALSGNKLVVPPKTHTFTLIAIDENERQVESTALVNVFAQILPPEIIKFEASPETINRGQKSTLRWRAQNADEILLDGDIVESEGERDATPQTTKTYTITVKNKAGQMQIKTAKVFVIIPKRPKIHKFSANPLIIIKGKGHATLYWETEDASEVQLNKQSVALSGSMKVNPAQTTTYELIAQNDVEKTTVATADVVVEMPNPPQIIFFSANPDSIAPGESTKLSWATVDATQVKVQGKNVSSSGNFLDHPRKSTSYSLVAISDGGKETRSVAVEVIDPPRIIHFYPKPDRIWEGELCQLVWKTENANQASIDGSKVSLSGSKGVRPQATKTYTLIVKDKNGKERARKIATVHVDEKPSVYRTLIYSLTPKNIVEDKRVEKAIREIVESGNQKMAKRLLSEAGYPDGVSLVLSLSKFQSSGGSIKEAQIMVAKLAASGFKIKMVTN